MIKNGLGIISLKTFNGYVDKNNKIPQYVHFRCGRIHINNNLRNIGIGIRYKLQSCLLKQESGHDGIYEDTWESKEGEWFPYVKSDVLSESFARDRYSKGMEKITGFGMKNSLTLPSLATKYFNSLRNENDEPIYTYNDKYMGWFVRRAIKSGRCVVLNQWYKSEIFDRLFDIISSEINVRCLFVRFWKFILNL